MTYNTKSKYSHLRIIVDKIQHSIEVVEEYKYLGMWISKNNKKHLESLEKNGRRSAFFTSRKLKEFGNINSTVIKEAFEMLTLSQIKYCGELCFDNNLTALNTSTIYKYNCNYKYNYKYKYNLQFTIYKVQVQIQVQVQVCKYNFIKDFVILKLPLHRTAS